MSSVPSRIRAVTAWLTLLACVWTVCAVSASETVCVRGMVMRTPVCVACAHPAPVLMSTATHEAPGGPHASLQSHCCVVRSTQVTPAVAPAAPPALATAALAPALTPEPVAPLAFRGASPFALSAFPPLPPQRNSPTILRL